MKLRGVIKNGLFSVRLTVRVDPSPLSPTVSLLWLFWCKFDLKLWLYILWLHICALKRILHKKKFILIQFPPTAAALSQNYRKQYSRGVLLLDITTSAWKCIFETVHNENYISVLKKGQHFHICLWMNPLLVLTASLTVKRPFFTVLLFYRQINGNWLLNSTIFVIVQCSLGLCIDFHTKEIYYSNSNVLMLTCLAKCFKSWMHVI